MIRKAVAADVAAVGQTYIDLLTYEQEHGTSSNWVLGLYPTEAVAQRAFDKGTLYVLEEDGAVCGSMILNQEQSPEYPEADWRYEAAPEEVFVIHTLCIPPVHAGKGYGRTMVSYAIEHARQLGCKVIRLDTWAENKPAATLYQRFGFEYAGKTNVMLAGVIPEEQIFFELLLDRPENA